MTGVYQGVLLSVYTGVYTRVYLSVCVQRYIPGCTSQCVYNGVYQGVPLRVCPFCAEWSSLLRVVHLCAVWSSLLRVVPLCAVWSLSPPVPVSLLVEGEILVPHCFLYRVSKPFRHCFPFHWWAVLGTLSVSLLVLSRCTVTTRFTVGHTSHSGRLILHKSDILENPAPTKVSHGEKCGNVKNAKTLGYSRSERTFLSLRN